MTGVVHSAFLSLAVLTLLTSDVLSHDPQSPVSSKISDPAPLKLSVTPAYVNKKTSHVALHCEVDLSYGTKFETVHWMRIVKKTPQGWSLVAQVRDSTGTENKTEQVTAIGYIGSGNSLTDAYLKVTWNAHGDQAFGEYVCDALGIDYYLQFAIEKSSRLFVKDQNITTQDLLEMLTRTHSEIKKDTEDIADDVKEHTSMMNDLLSRVEVLERQMEEHVHNVPNGDDTITLNDTSRWPGGKIGMLMPIGGCPDDPQFNHNKTSYVMFHVESPPNRTCASHQPHFHLSEPFTTESSSECLVNLRFCEASNMSSTLAWPEGSYCINREMNQPCPHTFKEGRVVLDQVDGTSSHVVDSSVVNHFGTFTYLDFCCKESSSYDTPMVLPTDSPFYLYRFGGFCQNVKGMKVAREYIDIDTEDNRNGDKGYDAHPDIVIQPGQPTRIELCYYTIET